MKHLKLFITALVFSLLFGTVAMAADTNTGITKEKHPLPEKHSSVQNDRNADFYNDYDLMDEDDYDSWDDDQDESWKKTGDKPEVTKVFWQDYKSKIDELNLHGDFYNIEELGIKLFMPDIFQPIELEDYMKVLNYVAYFITDNEQQFPAIAVQYETSLDIEDFDDYLELMEYMGSYVTVLSECYINNLHCLTYRIPATGSIVVGTVIDHGVLEITFAEEDDEMMKVFEVIAASIQRSSDTNGSISAIDNQENDNEEDSQKQASGIADAFQNFIDVATEYINNGNAE